MRIAPDGAVDVFATRGASALAVFGERLYLLSPKGVLVARR